MGFNLTPYRLITFGANDNLSHEMVLPLFNGAKFRNFFKKCRQSVAFCCEKANFIE